MKIRAGFVANSSVCSFVIVGWPTKLSVEELAELFGIEGKNEDDIYDKVHNHEFIHLHGDCPYDYGNFIGVEVANWSDSDGYSDEAEFSLPELIEKLTEISKVAEKLELDAKSAGIYTGNYMC